ncbi:LytR/AlgR family response regulator transcription factor [Anaeropeptidivorans aminofermentans]|uniref:LytR/AlgR family response regulator transcription factor n=1 Tax=Anaeropeptidivorans aminofermentans TaxID=2934315 RepID=UPI0020253F93|nr:LytTR family DNA-binding domain-containing protein [Anaeropeptidivorans aminofermentans]
MLRIALCDDNNNAIDRYARLILQVAKKNQIEIELSSFSSGEALLFQYTDAPEQVDIIYLDIMMDKTNGMETARKLRDCHCKAQIIFLTSSEEYVYEAFDVNAIHYLLKEDTSIDKFENVFLKAAELALKKEDERFTFEFDGETDVIPMGEISYFEIWQRLVTVHYGAGKIGKFYASMEQLEDRLSGKDFVRTHRSFLVHLPYIAKFQRQSLLLRTGEEIPIGITYMQSLKRIFSDYISRLSLYTSRNSCDKGETS